MRFVYKAKQLESNRIIRGEASFKNEYELKQHLVSMQMIPIRVRTKHFPQTLLNGHSLFKAEIKTQDIAFILRQFAITIEAGLSIGSALELIIVECEHQTLKGKLEEVYKEVIRGKGLAEALEEQAVFPPLINRMIEAAELTGKLEEVLKKAADYMEEQLEVGKKIQRALIYPGIILVALMIAIGVILTQVIPSYVQMFMQVEANLPQSTKIIISLSDWIGKNWAILLIIIGLGIFLSCFLGQSPKGKRYKEEWILTLPVISRLKKQFITARWSESMALLLGAGIPIVQAIEQSGKIVGNQVAQEELMQILQAVKKGQSLSEALQLSQIFPKFMVSMVRIGEETGSLDEIFVKIGDYFNKQLKGTIDKLIIMIEPTLTVLIALVVGFMMFAIVTPTFTLATELM